MQCFGQELGVELASGPAQVHNDDEGDEDEDKHKDDPEDEDGFVVGVGLDLDIVADVHF